MTVEQAKKWEKLRKKFFSIAVPLSLFPGLFYFAYRVVILDDIKATPSPMYIGGWAILVLSISYYVRKEKKYQRYLEQNNASK